MDQLTAFCERWQIAELAVFGSVLRDDFRPDSDVDFLVTFAPDARRTLFDIVEMEEELAALLGREVDVVSRRGVERSKYWIRRGTILGSAEPIYVAG
jgi:predicted nucleotidyltransferase